MIDFLKKRNISVKEITGYSEVNELRLVNNSLKHSYQSGDKSVTEIEEFKNGSIQNFESLDNFYNRIMDYPSLFFFELLEKVEKEVNNFNEKKLENIAKKATNRMDKENAEKLIIEIRKKYK
jgi:regulator of sigma D